MSSPPIAISWSQLRVHGECKQKGALQRAGHRSPGADLRGFFHGMVVDTLMRDWLTDPGRDRWSMVDRLDDAITSVAADATANGEGVVRWKHAGDRAELRAFCVELLDRLEPILRDLVLPYEFQSGLRFNVPITVPYLDGTPTTVHLRGEMDLLVNPAAWIVWDLKATRDNQYWRKVAGQLIFYDLAVFALHGRPSSRVGLIQPMCAKPVVEWQVSEQARREMLAAILAMCRDIWAKDTPCKTDTSGCSFCEVRHACPRFAADPASGTVSLSASLRAAARTMEVAR